MKKPSYAVYKRLARDYVEAVGITLPHTDHSKWGDITYNLKDIVAFLRRSQYLRKLNGKRWELNTKYLIKG